MKRILSVVLALVLTLSLCACGSSTPSVEMLVSLADQIVSNHEPVTNAPYEFRALGYDEDENAYVVAVMVDMEKVSQQVSEMDVEEQLVDLVIATTVRYHDENTEAITLELSAIKSMLDANFMDTDVVVIVGFLDRNGDIVQFAD